MILISIWQYISYRIKYIFTNICTVARLHTPHLPPLATSLLPHTSLSVYPYPTIPPGLHSPLLAMQHQQQQQPAKKAKTEDNNVYRYPPCKKKLQSIKHGKCAACAKAGFTKQEYVDYVKANPRRSMPSAPQRRRAPPKITKQKPSLLQKKLCIIGAGPVGIEAALAFAQGGVYHVTLLEAGDDCASNVEKWGHVCLFSPWSYNTSIHGLDVLKKNRVPLPKDDMFPTGTELIDEYLTHLWEYLDNLEDQVELRTGCTVIGITRGTALKGDMGHKRSAQKFRVLSTQTTQTGKDKDDQDDDDDDDDDDEECVEEFDAVIDASGTYGNANSFGIGGLPALGERALLKRNDESIVSIIPNVAEQQHKYGNGRTTCVIGTGHSAITTINALRNLAIKQHNEKPFVKLVWATRRLDALYEVIKDDPLPERVNLNNLGNSLCGVQDTMVDHGFHVTHLGGMQLKQMKRIATNEETSRIELTFQHSLNNNKSAKSADESTVQCREDDVVVIVDEVIANVGFRPDMSMTRELQIHRCYATEGPMRLAAQLMSSSGGGGGDCLAQTSGGAESLLTPEQMFLCLGMKSYGRSSKFLLKIGNEQIEHAMELLGGGVYK